MDGTDDYWNWSSLREIDQSAGLAKGSAFRAFKRLLLELREHRDFVVLNAETDDRLVERWRAADRLYRGSLHPVLLAPAAAARVAASLTAAKDR